MFTRYGLQQRKRNYMTGEMIRKPTLECKELDYIIGDTDFCGFLNLSFAKLMVCV